MASEWQQLELRLPVVRDAEPTSRSAARPHLSLSHTAAEMSDLELLIALLGISSEPICAELAAAYGSFHKLAGVHPAALRDHGLSAGAIRKLDVVFEIARRYGEEEFVPGQPFRGSADIYAHFRERLASATVEHFIVVCLDNKHRKLSDVEVARGSLTSTVVHPRLCAATHALHAKGPSRVTIKIHANGVRAFLRHAERRAWCPTRLADLLSGPRIYRQHGLPLGPSWDDSGG